MLVTGFILFAAVLIANGFKWDPVNVVLSDDTHAVIDEIPYNNKALGLAQELKDLMNGLFPNASLQYWSRSRGLGCFVHNVLLQHLSFYFYRWNSLEQGRWSSKTAGE
jgi:hypothetical protein